MFSIIVILLHVSGQWHFFCACFLSIPSFSIFNLFLGDVLSDLTGNMTSQFLILVILFISYLFRINFQLACHSVLFSLFVCSITIVIRHIKYISPCNSFAEQAISWVPLPHILWFHFDSSCVSSVCLFVCSFVSFVRIIVRLTQVLIDLLEGNLYGKNLAINFLSMLIFPNK